MRLRQKSLTRMKVQPHSAPILAPGRRTWEDSRQGCSTSAARADGPRSSALVLARSVETGVKRPGNKPVVYLQINLRKARELLDILIAREQMGLSGSAKARRRSSVVRELILAHLQRQGASRISEISSAVGSSRSNVQQHLKFLEQASLIRADIPAGERARCTPYYSLPGGTAPARRSSGGPADTGPVYER